jgi:hypothetical protein
MPSLRNPYWFGLARTFIFPSLRNKIGRGGGGILLGDKAAVWDSLPVD